MRKMQKRLFLIFKAETWEVDQSILNGVKNQRNTTHPNQSEDAEARHPDEETEDAIIAVLETISSKTAERGIEEGDIDQDLVAEVEAEIAEEDLEEADILDQRADLGAEVDRIEEGEEAVHIVVRGGVRVIQERVSLGMRRRKSKFC